MTNTYSPTPHEKKLELAKIYLRSLVGTEYDVSGRRPYEDDGTVISLEGSEFSKYAKLAYGSDNKVWQEVKKALHETLDMPIRFPGTDIKIVRMK